ncbi:MAG: acetaldehyde dehydrogenase (acetylating) [Bacteroidetes bacterium]|nr:acetaldehyde dehydrogenase (acetylating) [Bacteroidota bacterium]
MNKMKCAIIGSGNIGTDLMVKIIRNSNYLEVMYLVGIDQESDGLKRAQKLGVKTIHEGLEGLEKLPDFKDIKIFFDATSAKAHLVNNGIIQKYPGKFMIDLTPAAIGPYMVPSVNLENKLDQINVNMVTCGGQATIPIVHAISRITKTYYGEIVSAIASKSAGPGTRANIDEFTQTTAHGIEVVGGAAKGKAIIILNPADPPIMMRNTVFTLSEMADQQEIRKSIHDMVKAVNQYVPGYHLKQEVQFEEISEEVYVEGLGKVKGLKTTVFLQVEGAGHYLPPYAGNLDIMTSAAKATAEKIAQKNLHFILENK